MIKLKDILKEIITTEQKTTSWLSPGGEFIHSSHNHGSSAYDIVKKLGIELKGESPINHLEKTGWMRITYYSRGTLYCSNEFRPPNNLQKRLLIDLTIEVGFDNLVYDNGHDTFPIWSKKDTLQEAK